MKENMFIVDMSMRSEHYTTAQVKHNMIMEIKTNRI